MTSSYPYPIPLHFTFHKSKQGVCPCFLISHSLPSFLKIQMPHKGPRSAGAGGMPRVKKVYRLLLTKTFDSAIVRVVLTSTPKRTAKKPNGSYLNINTISYFKKLKLLYLVRTLKLLVDIHPGKASTHT